MAIVPVGIDLAKNVFAVHAVDEHGKPALERARQTMLILGARAVLAAAKNKTEDRFLPPG
jgi:transposase